MVFVTQKKKTIIATLIGVVFVAGFVIRFAYAEYYNSCGSTGSFFSLNWGRSNCGGEYPSPSQPDFTSNSNDVTVANDGVTLSNTIELGGDDTLRITAPSFTIAAGAGGSLNINGGTVTISDGGNLINENDGNLSSSGLLYQSGTFQITYGSVTNGDPTYLAFTSAELPFTPSQQTSHHSYNFNVLTIATSPWSLSGEHPPELTIDSMTGTISAGSEIIGDETGILYVSGTVSSGSATQAISYTLDDITNPTITALDASSNTYSIGDIVTITVMFSEPVSLSGGEPNLTLSNGESATYSSGSGSSEWYFTYTVAEGDGDSLDLNVTDSNLSANIYDTGNNSVTSPSMPSSPNTLAENADVVIDANGPQVSSITSDTPDGTYTEGQIINIQVTFTEPISTTGSATLSFTSGGTSATASAVDGDTATFSYTVGSGEATSDLDVTGINDYYVIADVAGNVMGAETLPVNPSYTLAGTKNIVIESGNNTPPVEVPLVQSLTPVTEDGTYGVGEQILFDVDFSENVYVTGTPVIDLNSGGTAEFVSVSGDTMRFSYTVVEGDSSNDLDAGGTNAFSLAGGSILDADDNEATLTLPVPGGEGSLSANANIIIDTTVVESGTSGSGGGRSSAPSASRPSDENLSLTITALTGTSVNVAGAHVPDVIVTDEFGYAYKESSESNWKIFTERTNIKTEARFSRMIDTLTCNTTYVFRAFAKNRVGMTHSDFVTVTTPACDAAVEQVAHVASQDENVGETSKTNQLPTVTRVLVCPIFKTLLAPGDTDTEVSRLKVFLNFLFPDLRLNIQSLQYDTDAQVGVKRFQKMYEATILAPLGLIEPTGWWQQASIDQANALLGCGKQ